jgi:hypothetical protein
MQKSLIILSILFSGFVSSCGDISVCDCKKMYDEENSINPIDVPQFRKDNEAKYDDCKALVKKLGDEEWYKQKDACK